MLNLENKIDMRLDQYDKLEQNVRKSVKYILDLKSVWKIYGLWGLHMPTT